MSGARERKEQAKGTNISVDSTGQKVCPSTMDLEAIIKAHLHATLYTVRFRAVNKESVFLTNLESTLSGEM